MFTALDNAIIGALTVRNSSLPASAQDTRRKDSGYVPLSFVLAALERQQTRKDASAAAEKARRVEWYAAQYEAIGEFYPEPEPTSVDTSGIERLLADIV